MTAPVSPFTVLPLGDVDPESPVTTDLMNALRQNDLNLWAQLVGDPASSPPFTAAAEHDHDGVNSKAVAGANYRHIATAEVTGSPVASINFTGLDGPTDAYYVAIGYIIRGIAGTVTDYMCRVNNISSSGYNNTGAFPLTGFGIFETILTTEAQTSVQFKMELLARKAIQGVDVGFSAVVHAQLVNALPAAGNRFEINQGAYFNITPPFPTITSLDFVAATAGNVYGVGSRISLYKILEN